MAPARPTTVTCRLRLPVAALIAKDVLKTDDTEHRRCAEDRGGSGRSRVQSRENTGRCMWSGAMRRDKTRAFDKRSFEQPTREAASARESLSPRLLCCAVLCCSDNQIFRSISRAPRTAAS